MNKIIYNKQTGCFERIYEVDPGRASSSELSALRSELVELIFSQEKQKRSKYVSDFSFDASEESIRKNKNTLAKLDKIIFDKVSRGL